jgi:2-methylisocitrate lyase-like PEP mutase family enzyme
MADIREFQRLHQSGCFVIPNPWDVGSARYLRHLGFAALATTSAGFAFSQGLPDAGWAVPRDSMLRHIAELVGATELPVNADYESGYAHEPGDLAENVKLCVATGVAGLSIEDATGSPTQPLYEPKHALERIRAARVAIDSTNSGVLLTARSECYLVGHPDPLREAIRRLQSFAEVGADVLYAPGPVSVEDIQTIVNELKPKPVNILMSSNTGVTVGQLAEMGVRRISVGSSMARAAWTGFARAARNLAEEGSFAGFDNLLPYAELNELFKA